MMGVFDKKARFQLHKKICFVLEINYLQKTRIRIMCHEKLHWDINPSHRFIWRMYQNYVPWKVALRHYWQVDSTHYRIRIMCHEKLHWDLHLATFSDEAIDQNYVPWKVALRPSGKAPRRLLLIIRIMCHEKLHWDPPEGMKSWTSLYQNYVPWKVALRLVGSNITWL